jgi:hypothetical protein
MLFRYLFGLILVCGSAVAVADEVDLTLSDNSALFRYIQHSNSSYGHSELDAGFLYTNSSDFLAMVGMQVKGEAGSGSPGLHVGVGVKGFSVNTVDYGVLAVAIGGELHYSLASMSRLSFRGQLYHAPAIVTFMDANRFTYGALSIEYKLLQQATMYLGYRNVTVGRKGFANADLDDDTHIGMRIEF